MQRGSTLEQYDGLIGDFFLSFGFAARKDQPLLMWSSHSADDCPAGATDWWPDRSQSVRRVQPTWPPVDLVLAAAQMQNGVAAAIHSSQEWRTDRMKWSHLVVWWGYHARHGLSSISRSVQKYCFEVVVITARLRRRWLAESLGSTCRRVD